MSARAAEFHPSHSWVFKPQSQPWSSSRSGDAQAGGWRQHPRWDCSQCCSIASSSSLLDSTESAPGMLRRAFPAVMGLFSCFQVDLGAPQRWYWSIPEDSPVRWSPQLSPAGAQSSSCSLCFGCSRGVVPMFLECHNITVEKNRNYC